VNSNPAAPLRIGTSSWSSPDWVGPFYPPGTAPGDFISVYAQRFDTVEVDSSFYRTPSRQMVESWVRKTPPGFLFALKVPQVITHEKLLMDCQRKWIPHLRRLLERGVRIYGYFNNHYAGHAPASVELFQKIWNGN
jgi:uncharacterized protein YecE (DUF72 family)